MTSDKFSIELYYSIAYDHTVPLIRPIAQYYTAHLEYPYQIVPTLSPYFV